MATDDAEDAGILEGPAPDSTEEDASEGTTVTVGEYTWAEFMADHGHGDEVGTLTDRDDEGDSVAHEDSAAHELDAADGPGEYDWEQVTFSPETYLGFRPSEFPDRLGTGATQGTALQDQLYGDPAADLAPVSTRHYTWEHYKHEFYYEDGSPPSTRKGEEVPFDPSETLGFDPGDTAAMLGAAGSRAERLQEIVDERTVDTTDLDEDAFFSDVDGLTTVTNRYDLEKAVPAEKKRHFEEIERYWVNKPYAFVIIFRSRKENETKYYLVEPYLTPIEEDLRSFLSEKLRTAIKYASDDVLVEGEDEDRSTVIERVMDRLLARYDLYETDDGAGSLMDPVRDRLENGSFLGRLAGTFGVEGSSDEGPQPLDGMDVRPEPVLIDEDDDVLSEYQVEKLKYLLRRDFVGYERIDGIKHDINVEDISCDGYNSPVFVYHSEYEQIISNVYHGKERLDDFVVKLAQRSGKGISKRQPQVDATLTDGSRAQLTLGAEVSDHGTNYTIRQFKDVPFTPIDLINWHTFSLDQMAYLWLCIENHKSLIFAGGTASGKTTSLNAVSLFIPSNAKIVSIEDTREVELPQRNWIASVTRPSFSQDDQGDIDEFDLLEAALRQRPDYIVMGEIRGEEGRTLFQVMSTGHTTYTTFHADTVGEVLKRFTTEPINVSKTLFTALDLVSIQTQTRVKGNKVRKSKSITEINHYDAENDEINVQDVYQWRAETDEFLQVGDSSTLDEIMFDRGWSHERLQEELFKRRVIIAYLIRKGLNQYAQVAATIQAFINDPDTLLALVANDALGDSLEDLREMESVLIDIDAEKEALVPRPDPTDEVYEETGQILEEAEERLFAEYRGLDLDGEDLLAAIEPMREESADDASDEPLVEAPTSGDGLDELERWIKEGGAVGEKPASADEADERTASADSPVANAEASQATGSPQGTEEPTDERTGASVAGSTDQAGSIALSDTDDPDESMGVSDPREMEDDPFVDSSSGDGERARENESERSSDPREAVRDESRDAPSQRSEEEPRPTGDATEQTDGLDELDDDIVGAFDETHGKGSSETDEDSGELLPSGSDPEPNAGDGDETPGRESAASGDDVEDNPFQEWTGGDEPGEDGSDPDASGFEGPNEVTDAADREDGPHEDAEGAE